MQSEASKAHRRGLHLSFITVGYNVVEGVISIIAGILAGSVALVGFGLDSFIESLSGSIMIWRFSKHGKISAEDEERVEKKAVKFVGYTFFILGAYVLYESLKKLYTQEMPEPSIIGIFVAITSLMIMPILFIMKYRIGKTIKSRSLIADSKETLACVFLSAALLIGLGTNYLFGYWQADPIIGIVIVVFLFREGYTTLKEESVCSC